MKRCQASVLQPLTGIHSATRRRYPDGMSAADPVTPDPHRFSLRLPRPLWIGLAMGVLISVSVRFPSVADVQKGTSEEQNTARIISACHPFCKNGKWGYVDNQGQVAIEPQFDSAHDFSEGLAAVSNSTDGAQESGYIQSDGKWAFRMPDSDWAFAPFSGGRARFSTSAGRQFGYVDPTGRIIVEPKFDRAMDFSEGRARVAIGEWIDEFPSPRFRGTWGYIDRDGQLVITANLTDASEFSDGLALISRSESGYEFVNAEGNSVLRVLSLIANMKRSVSFQGSFHSGLAPVGISDQGSGYIDRTGKLVIPSKFEMAREFSGGLAAVRTSEGFGFIDRAGAVVIAPRYDNVGKFHEGYARVKCREEWFFVDRRGCPISSRNCDLARRQVAASPWNDAEDFRGGLAHVHVGGKFHITNDGPTYWDGGIWYYVNAQ